MVIADEVLKNIYKFNSQYFYGEKVGIYVIKLRTKLLLIDLPSYSSEAQTFLSSFNKPIECFLTHGSTGIISGDRWRNNLDMKIFLHKKDEKSSWLKIKPNKLFVSEPTVSKEIEVIHTPGHSPGSISIFHKKSKSIFTGDTLSGDLRGNIRNFFIKDDPERYNFEQEFESIQKFSSLDFENIFPFHYQDIIGLGKLKYQEFIAKQKHKL